MGALKNEKRIKAAGALPGKTGLAYSREKDVKMSRLSVVLPAYNEELMVGKTCRVLHEVLSEAGISYELVVVDDGSKDRTWQERKMEMCLVYIFPEISEKKQQYMQALPRRQGMW